MNQIRGTTLAKAQCVTYDSSVSSSTDASHVSHRFYRARTAGALANAVRGARDTHGLTQSELADAIGSSRPTISRMERGAPVAADTVLAALAECGYEVVVVPRGSRVTVAP